MKKILALACAVCAFPTMAAEVNVGIGATAESNDSTIYVPIDINDAWRIEPFVSYARTKSDTGISDKQMSFGTGLFGLKPLGESLRIYYGGRLSYLDIEQTFHATPYGPIHQESDGFRVAPTFGFEYSFNKHISFGAEASWFYEEIESGSPGEIERSGTDTKLILRLRF